MLPKVVQCITESRDDFGNSKNELEDNTSWSMYKMWYTIGGGGGKIPTHLGGGGRKKKNKQK